jgi:hypothetical protein
MSVLYAVRTRFTEPAREDEWNEWYAEHIDVLLGVPGFLSAQRFYSEETVDDRPYLAMYEVSSRDVFTSEPYLAIWGFDDWTSLIDNWTRDLFVREDGQPFDFGTPLDGRLCAAFVSGDDESVRHALDELGERWAASTAIAAGLDVSCGGVAWAVLSGDERPQPPDASGGAQIAGAIYRPVNDYLTSPRAVS